MPSLKFSSAWKAARRFRSGRNSSKANNFESESSSDNSSAESSDNEDDNVLGWSVSSEAKEGLTSKTRDSETLRIGGPVSTSSAAVTAVTAWDRTRHGEVDVLQGARALRQAAAVGSPDYVATTAAPAPAAAAAAAAAVNGEEENNNTSNHSGSKFDIDESTRNRNVGKLRFNISAPSMSAPPSAKSHSSPFAATSTASEEANFKRSVAVWAKAAANFSGGPTACSGVSGSILPHVLVH